MDAKVIDFQEMCNSTKYSLLLPLLLAASLVFNPVKKMTQNGDETRARNRQIHSEVTLIPPLLDLPSHLIEEILFRVPVKSLLQPQCLCKELNSLISDLKFRKNHLRFCFSTNRFQVHTNIVTQLGYGITSYPIHSLFSTTDLITTSTTSFKCPRFSLDKYFSPCIGIVGSCHEEELPLSFAKEEEKNIAYGFGYDPLSHNYKVVVKRNTRVKIHTLGTHIWRRIDNFPFGFLDPVGVYLSGTVNWLASNDIVSLDLGNECFQQLPLPLHGRTISLCGLSVQRDCLCLLADHDVWMMKEFGNQNSWTKLITIPYIEHPFIFYCFRKLLYISEDDIVMLVAYGSQANLLQANLLSYDSRNDIFKYHILNPVELSVESLISP